MKLNGAKEISCVDVDTKQALLFFSLGNFFQLLSEA